MPAYKSVGQCRFCKQDFSQQGISKHLEQCQAYNASPGNEPVYLIKASSGPFWVYFEISKKKKVSHMDHFLRDIWMECCGHLSAFTIRNQRYSSYEEELDYDEKSMESAVGSALLPKEKFTYEYDFGTSTDVELTCVKEKRGKNAIAIIARNKMIEFKCTDCTAHASELCSQCAGERGASFCKKCAKKHECGEEMMLPLVNSPRSGMCGFMGDCRLIDA